MEMITLNNMLTSRKRRHIVGGLIFIALLLYIYFCFIGIRIKIPDDGVVYLRDFDGASMQLSIRGKDSSDLWVQAIYPMGITKTVSGRQKYQLYHDEEQDITYVESDYGMPTVLEEVDSYTLKLMPLNRYIKLMYFANKSYYTYDNYDEYRISSSYGGGNDNTAYIKYKGLDRDYYLFERNYASFRNYSMDRFWEYVILTNNVSKVLGNEVCSRQADKDEFKGNFFAYNKLYFSSTAEHEEEEAESLSVPLKYEGEIQTPIYFLGSDGLYSYGEKGIGRLTDGLLPRSLKYSEADGLFLWEDCDNICTYTIADGKYNTVEIGERFVSYKYSNGQLALVTQGNNFVNTLYVMDITGDNMKAVTSRQRQEIFYAIDGDSVYYFDPDRDDCLCKYTIATGQVTQVSSVFKYNSLELRHMEAQGGELYFTNGDALLTLQNGRAVRIVDDIYNIVDIQGSILYTVYDEGIYTLNLDTLEMTKVIDDYDGSFVYIVNGFAVTSCSDILNESGAITAIYDVDSAALVKKIRTGHRVWEEIE